MSSASEALSNAAKYAREIAAEHARDETGDVRLIVLFDQAPAAADALLVEVDTTIDDLGDGRVYPIAVENVPGCQGYVYIALCGVGDLEDVLHRRDPSLTRSIGQSDAELLHPLRADLLDQRLRRVWEGLRDL